jgi:hypothetical protein
MGARTVLEKAIAAGEKPGEKAPQRAVALPPLRPYLPSRAHLRRVLAGLVALAVMAWRGVAAGLTRATAPPMPKKSEKKAADVKGQAKDAAQAKKDEEATPVADVLERLGVGVLVVVVGGAVVAGAVRFAAPRVAPYAWILVTVFLIGLLAAAWAVAPEAKPKAPAEPQAGGGEARPEAEPLPQAVEPLDAATVAATVRQIATPRGWKGVHLDDVLAHLPGHSREDLLRALAEASITVTEQLKLTLPGGRQRNRQGIRLAHLPAAPDQPAAEAPPEVLVEVAPEPAPRPVPVTVYRGE